MLANFETLADKEQQEGAARLRDEFAGDDGVRLGGEAPGNVDVVETVRSDIVRAELIAFPLLLLLGIWIFRSLVAALLPVVVGGLSIAVAIAALRLASEAMSVSIFALNLVVGLGLGLAIDYSLLIVHRFREERAARDATTDALARTMRTAGRAVLFSSLTVAAALAALLLFPQRFLYSMGLGGMIVALVAGAAALVVLPAMLALLGPRVDALSTRRLRLAAEHGVRPDESGRWYRLAQLVTAAQGGSRRPARCCSCCSASPSRASASQPSTRASCRRRRSRARCATPSPSASRPTRRFRSSSRWTIAAARTSTRSRAAWRRSPTWRACSAPIPSPSVRR